ncbi:MAG: VOC family protein [Pseudomonadota bacterium]
MIFTAICPTFPSRDLEATSAFYNQIRFHQVAMYEEEGYLILLRDELEIHFWRKPDHRPESSEFGAYLRTENVDAIGEELAKLGLPMKGIPCFEPPENKPWGMREINLIDPEGHLLRIGEDIPNG